MDVSKNRDTIHPKWMFDGLFHGKHYFILDDLGGGSHIFGKHPYVPMTRVIFV